MGCGDRRNRALYYIIVSRKRAITGLPADSTRVNLRIKRMRRIRKTPEGAAPCRCSCFMGTCDGAGYLDKKRSFFTLRMSIWERTETAVKILLLAVNAKYIHSNLAVYSLRAYAEKYRDRELPVQIEIAEYTINNRVEEILAGVYKARPDVLCVSCYIWNIACISEVAAEYGKLCPDVPIWAGGPEVSWEAERFLREHPAVTGVMCGEGEQTFLELCTFYGEAERERGKGFGEQGCRLREIRGLVFRERGCGGTARETTADGAPIAEHKGCLQSVQSVAFTGERAPVDMNTIPFCYDDIEDFENRIIYYESSRGCPFCCSYCLSSLEKQMRFRDTETVKRELSFFLEMRVPQVKFVDRTFNCRHEHAMEIWRFIEEHDNGVTNFHFEISADLLLPEETALIRSMRPGLVQFEIGVQTTNPATLEEIHRRTDLLRLKEAVERLQQGNNVHIHLDLIAGLPYEDYDTFVKSFDEIYALRTEQLQLGFLKVLKGSYIYRHAAEYGLVFREGPPYEVLRTNWLDYEEILRLKQAEEMLEVYYNSGQFAVSVELLTTCYESAFALYQSMGAFYERHGYFSMSHSRIRRAEILLEFAMEEQKEAVPVLLEGLMFDLYCRENAKSRPRWGADVSEWKELTRKFCRNGKMTHVERFFYRFSVEEIRRSGKLPEREAEACYVLFDYGRRNPLNYQADWRYITEGENIRC